MPDLTPRKRQRLTMIGAGRGNSDISELMGFGSKTAEKHRASLMAKLSVRLLVELMSKALKEGLIEPNDLLR